ncbi:hypothetical protein I4U23_006893 [Adineta vaga]|nr:hypothetical protein I4U23_006893 [Adineta vaga]
MPSQPGFIGFEGLNVRQRSAHAEFEEEYDHDESMNDTSVRRVHTPMFSAIYDEIVTVWFKIQWLIFDENHQETFLMLKSYITDCVTIQKAIDQKSFVNNKYHLHNLPECLLIRTESDSNTIFLPNSILSFDRLLHKSIRSNEYQFQGQLIAILCKLNEKDSKLMFYKHLRTNIWYTYFNNPDVSSEYHSNMLCDGEQTQLETIGEENNQRHFNHSSQLTFPLSALTIHPITYVYLTKQCL